MENLPKAFFSYSRINKDRITFFQEEFKKRGVEIWRDEENLYGGQHWPRELGDAIAACPCFLLFWSKEAKESHYIGVEWNIAFALERHIIPCLLDQTPLPNSLRAFQAVNLQVPDVALPKLIYELKVKVLGFIPDSNREAEVLTSLSKIPSTDPQSVLANFHSIIIQHKWNIQGDRNLIAGGDINITVTSPPIGARDTQLQNLLEGVEQTWINGVLKNSLQNVVQVELGKEIDLNLVDHPLKEIVEISSPKAKPLPSMYEEQKSLLILGEPGSGKTTSLLELAEYLVHRAASDPRQPIPVVFNLSTWSDRYKNFDTWLLEEFNNKYHAPKAFSRKCLSKHWCILLLDGLDEIKASYRLSCINAINDFIKEIGVPGIAVCSRLQEYREIQSHFQFKVGLILEPLSDRQVAYSLHEAGLYTDGLYKFIENDEPFRNLLRTPLFLSILILTFKDHPEEVIELEKIKTQTEWRPHLFEKYVERMFERKGQRKLNYSPKVVKEGLSWLAQQMMKHSQTVFLLENLQPSWLSSGKERGGYWVSSRMLSGILLASPFLWPLFTKENLSTGNLFVFIVVGSMSGIIDGLIFERKIPLVTNRATISIKGLHLALHCFAIFLAIYFYGSIRQILIDPPPYFPGLLQVGASSLLLGLVFGCRSINRNREIDIKTFEGLGWSHIRAQKGFFIGYGFGAMLWLSIPLVFDLLGILPWGVWGGMLFISVSLALMSADILLTNLVYRMVNPNRERFPTMMKGSKHRKKILLILLVLHLAVIFVSSATYSTFQADFLSYVKEGSLPVHYLFIYLFFILGSRIILGVTLGAMGCLFGIKKKGVEGKIQPNQGIKLTLFHSTSVALTIMILLWVIFFWGTPTDVMQGRERLFKDIFLSIFCGILVAFYSGTPDVIQHYLLRLIFWIRGHTVIRLDRFLESAKDLLFLQRVGGGYIFIHRLLLEYFSELKNPVSNRKVETNKFQML